MRYWTASEDQHDTGHRGLRRVVHVTPPGGSAVPAGTTHAVHAETTQLDGHTVCWEPLAKLVLWRNTNFEGTAVQASQHVELCSLCVEYVTEDGR